MKAWKEKIKEVKSTVEKIQRGEIEFFRSGFLDVDDVLYGSIMPGAHIIVAGSTSMGKTMVMINMALRLAQLGKRVRFFSLENSVHSLVVRLVSNLTMIPTKKIRTGDLTDEELKELDKGYEELEALDLDIFDSIFKPEELCKKVELEKPEIFFVDYIQIMYLSDGDKGRNRTQEVGKISKMLRQTAKLSEAISIVGAQLNREVFKRGDKRPVLSDLRDSGEIEQDGDLVALLYRESYYEETDENKDKLEILLAKNREGPTGSTTLRWLPEISRVEDVEEKRTAFSGKKIRAWDKKEQKKPAPEPWETEGGEDEVPF